MAARDRRTRRPPASKPVACTRAAERRVRCAPHVPRRTGIPRGIGTRSARFVGSATCVSIEELSSPCNSEPASARQVRIRGRASVRDDGVPIPLRIRYHRARTARTRGRRSTCRTNPSRSRQCIRCHPLPRSPRAEPPRTPRDRRRIQRGRSRHLHHIRPRGALRTSVRMSRCRRHRPRRSRSRSRIVVCSPTLPRSSIRATRARRLPTHRPPRSVSMNCAYASLVRRAPPGWRRRGERLHRATTLVHGHFFGGMPCVRRRFELTIPSARC